MYSNNLLASKAWAWWMLSQIMKCSSLTETAKTSLTCKPRRQRSCRWLSSISWSWKTSTGPKPTTCLQMLSMQSARRKISRTGSKSIWTAVPWAKSCSKKSVRSSIQVANVSLVTKKHWSNSWWNLHSTMYWLSSIKPIKILQKEYLLHKNCTLTYNKSISKTLVLMATTKHYQ